MFADRHSGPIVAAPVSGPAGEALNAETIEGFWELLFNTDMIRIIVEFTNIIIEEVCVDLVAREKLETYHHNRVDNDRLAEKKKMVQVSTAAYFQEINLNSSAPVFVSTTKVREMKMIILRRSGGFATYL